MNKYTVYYCCGRSFIGARRILEAEVFIADSDDIRAVFLECFGDFTNDGITVNIDRLFVEVPSKVGLVIPLRITAVGVDMYSCVVSHTIEVQAMLDENGTFDHVGQSQVLPVDWTFEGRSTELETPAPRDINNRFRELFNIME